MPQKKSLAPCAFLGQDNRTRNFKVCLLKDPRTMLKVLVLLACVCVATATRQFPCAAGNETVVCGVHASCLETAKCVCDEKWGTLSIDNAPCTRPRVSKMLAFWLQVIFGWLQVGAFVLEWVWLGASVFIVYAILCCCLCGAVYTESSNGPDGVVINVFRASQCVGTIVVLALWTTTLVYIVTDCFSVVTLDDGKQYSLECWENM